MRRGIALAAGLALIVGCESTPPDGDMQSGEFVADAQDMRDTFDQMADAALLADMTVSDYHFVPLRSMLTPLGEQRLVRLAHLLDEYGGEVRFNSNSTDKALTQQRLETVIAFLQTQGVDTTAEVVREDLPGSLGMSAEEAVLIKKNEGTYTPPKDAGGGLGAPPTAQ
jgi:hypothetical protein